MNITDEMIDDWLVDACGKGIPFKDATDLPTMLHGLAYVLRQIDAAPGYKVNIGQLGPASSAIRMALRHFAREALSSALSLVPQVKVKPAPETHVAGGDNAIAARYHRLHGICERILWTDLGVPAMESDQTRSAMAELSEVMLMDALISAAATTEGSTDG